MAGECVGIGQMVHSMRSSIPIRDSMIQFRLPPRTPALQRNCRPSPCSHGARASLTQNISPKHGATERVEEFTPFCTAASSIGALPTLSDTSEHYPSPLCDVAQKQSTSRRRTQYERSHTSTDYVVLRRRRSRLRVVFENPQSFRNHPRPPSTHLNITKSFKTAKHQKPARTLEPQRPITFKSHPPCKSSKN